MPDVVRVVRAAPVGPVTVRVQRDGDAVRVIRPPAPPATVRVSRQGPPGKPGRDGIDGEDGADGASGTHAERAFSTADTAWDWTHDLGFTPAVTVLTTDRRQITGSVVLNTTSRTVVEFYSPVAGILALS